MLVYGTYDDLPNLVKTLIVKHYIAYNTFVLSIREKQRQDSLVRWAFLYLVYLGLLCFVATAFTDQTAKFYYAESLREALQSAEFPDYHHPEMMISYNNITTEANYWQWFEKVIVPEVIGAPDQDFRDAHTLLWGVHMRVVRVGEGGSCSVPEIMKKAFNISECYLDEAYTDCITLATDLSNFTDSNGTFAMPFDDALDLSSLTTSRGTGYGGGGYIQPFSFGMASSQNISNGCGAEEPHVLQDINTALGVLKPLLLADQPSSVPAGIVVSVYTYCYNLNLFGRTRMIFEITPGGSFTSNMYVQSGQIIRRKTSIETTAALCALVVAGLSGFYIGVILFYQRCECSNWAEFFGTLYDFSMFMTTGVTMALLVLQFNADRSEITDVLNGGVSSYPSAFGAALDVEDTVTIMLAVSLLMAVFRMFAFVRLSMRLHVVVKTITQSLRSMGFMFLFIFTVLFFQYALFANRTFGARLSRFSKFSSSALLQLEALEHEPSFSQMRKYYPTAAPVFYASFYFLFSWVLINVGLAFVVVAWLYEAKRHFHKHGGSKALLEASKYNSQLMQLGYSLKTMLLKPLGAINPTVRMKEDAILEKCQKWKQKMIETGHAADTYYINYSTLANDIFVNVEKYGHQIKELLLYTSAEMISLEEKNARQVCEFPDLNAPTPNASVEDVTLQSLKGMQKKFACLELAQDAEILGLQNGLKSLRTQQQRILQKLRKFDNKLQLAI